MSPRIGTGNAVSVSRTLQSKPTAIRLFYKHSLHREGDCGKEGESRDRDQALL